MALAIDDLIAQQNRSGRQLRTATQLTVDGEPARAGAGGGSRHNSVAELKAKRAAERQIAPKQKATERGGAKPKAERLTPGLRKAEPKAERKAERRAEPKAERKAERKAELLAAAPASPAGAGDAASATLAAAVPVGTELPPSCEVLQAPGYWSGPHSLDWTIHGSDRCPVPLHSYVRIDRSACSAKVTGKSGLPTSLPSCVVQDRPRLDALRNGSILMLGDSTSAQLLMHACDAFSSKATSFIANATYFANLPDRSKYQHRLRSMDNHACRLLSKRSGSDSGKRGGLGLPFGSFSHYGATGPPYWAFAYPLAPWLARTSVVQAGRTCRPSVTNFLCYASLLSRSYSHSLSLPVTHSRILSLTLAYSHSPPHP